MADSTVPVGRVPLQTLTKSEADDHDSGVPMTEYVADAHSTTPEVFAQLHGDGFLLRWIHDGELDKPARLGSKDWRKHTNLLGAPRSDTQPKMGTMSPDAFFVYQLPFHQRKTLLAGRAHTAQVCISDMSVSTMHAELELDDAGRLVVTDRGSTNGTHVGANVVEFGDSATVDFGKTVQFGSVKLTFMPVQQFIDFVRFATESAPVEVL